MINIINKELLSSEYFGLMYNNKYPDDMLVDHHVHARNKQDPRTYFDVGYPIERLNSVFVHVMEKKEGKLEHISPNYQHNLITNVNFPEETVGPGYYKGPDRNWYTWSGITSSVAYSSNKKNREHVKLKYHLSRDKDEDGYYEIQVWYYDPIKLVGVKIWNPCFMIEEHQQEDNLKFFVNAFENWTQNRKIVLDSAKKNIKELENKKDF